MGYFVTRPWIGLLSTLLMLLGAAAVLAAPAVRRKAGRAYVPLAAAVYLATRIGLLLAILRVLGRPSGPDKLYWAAVGSSALKGLLPYIDFRCVQGPLFPYLLAPAFLFFDALLAPIVVFILFDLLAFLALHWVAEDVDTSRQVAVLYLVTPLSWFMVVRYGQDEGIAAFFAVLLLILARTRRDWLVGLVAGLATAATKVLLVITVVPILMQGQHRARALVVAATVLLSCYLPFLSMGADTVQWRPAPHDFYGPNVWAAFGLGRKVPWPVVMAASNAVGGILGLLVLWRARRMGVVNAVLLLYSGLMLTIPKAGEPYGLFVLPFLCLRVAQSGKRSELAFFSVYSFFMVFNYDILSIGHHPLWSLPWFASAGTSVAIVAYNAYLLVTSLRAAWAREDAAGASAGPGRTIGTRAAPA